MADTEVIDVESTDLVPVGQVSIYASQDPEEQLAEAQRRSKVLLQVITDQELAVSFGGGRKHVQVEGWLFLASQFGLMPDIEWTRELDNGWEARCALRRLSDGQVISHADAECRTAESNWNNRDSYAVRSMAETRAVSKVCRIALSSVMVMAGFAATPAEEMSSAFAGAQSGNRAKKPASPDNPHCPACYAVNNELVAVQQFDKKPFWRCERRGDECAGSREYKGKTYSWSGWHDSWEKSAKEWLDDNGYGGARTVEIGERGNNWGWVLTEIITTLGVDKTEAKARAQTALSEVIDHIDLAAALADENYPNVEDLTFDHWSAIAVYLTAAEAQLVVSAAVQHQTELGEAPF